MMLRDDPTAFREMVYEGLRVLEAAEKQTSPTSTERNLPRLAQALRPNHPDLNVALPSRAASVDPQATPPATPQLSNVSPSEAQLAAYSGFEKAANAELEKTVGTAINRALHQALPNIAATDRNSSVAARFPGLSYEDSASPGAGTDDATPLQARLSQAIREDVERALQNDRQLGEQVAQILAGQRPRAAARSRRRQACSRRMDPSHHCRASQPHVPQ
jgi:hypothetical protein